MAKTSKAAARRKTAKRKGLFSRRAPTPAAAAKKLGNSLKRLAQDSLSVVSSSLRRSRAAKKK